MGYGSQNDANACPWLFGSWVWAEIRECTIVEMSNMFHRLTHGCTFGCHDVSGCRVRSGPKYIAAVVTMSPSKKRKQNFQRVVYAGMLGVGCQWT